MAITNAQQYQQLVNKPANGKRPGYRGPGEYQGRPVSRADPRDVGFNASQAAANVGRASTAGQRGRGDVSGFDAREARISKQYSGITPTDDSGRIIPVKDKPPPKKPEETEFQKFKRRFNPFPFATSVLNRVSNSKLARINNALQRQNYINSLDLTNPEEKEEYDRIMNQLGGLGMDIIAGPEDLEDTRLTVPPSMLATDPMTQFKTVDGVSTLGNPGVDDVLGQGYQDYLNRFEKEDTGRDERPEEITDPCKGPNPPAYCFIGEKADETIKAQRNLAGLTPRIGGSIFNFDTFAADGGRIGAMNGGIMNVEDLDREAFLLGGIAKGLKKAVRGVKKIAKSKIGKAALLGALGYGLGGGTFFGRMLPGVTRGGQGFGGFGGLSSIFGNVGDIIGGTGLGDKFAKFAGNKIGMGILGASVLPLIFGKKQDDGFNIDQYYADNKLDPNAPLNTRIAGSEFDFYGGQTAADGGRIGYQEGGDAEPVAKKTMPLLDMDGKEKDYRETGGFVDMGRMERADDVPARLSKNEFVFTADAVRNAGEGNIDKGAEGMYNMMKNLEAGGEVSEESQGLEGARKMFQTSQRLGEVI